MELSEVLDDIQGDATPHGQHLNLPDSETDPTDLNQNVNLSDTSQDEGPLAKDFQALEQLRLVVMFKNALDKHAAVPKSFATEVFTMLPDLEDPMLVSKLTNAASAHNRSMLTTYLGRQATSKESMLPLITPIHMALEKAMQTLEQLESPVTDILAEINAQVKRVEKTAEIVFCRKRMNLLTTPINELLAVDDKLIDFEPYADKLVQWLRDIVATDIFYQLGQTCYRGEDFTIIGLVQYLRRFGCEIPEQRRALKSANELLLSYDSERFVQMNFNDLMYQLECVNNLKICFQKKPEMINALLTFLRNLV